MGQFLDSEQRCIYAPRDLKTRRVSADKAFDMLRPCLAMVAISIAVSTGPAHAGAKTPAKPSGFQAFVAELWPQAKARGVSRATFDAAFAGVEPDPAVLAATKRQPESIKAFGDYIGGFVGGTRIANGIRNAKKWEQTLDGIESKYGVDRFVLLSIWGVESAYGTYKPKWQVIRSLATLAHARYRGDFFHNELLGALRILEEGHVTPEDMRGSWAGALGQCQFLPNAFLKLAVDFSGDGRRDIWTNVPDVLASIANYLRSYGWEPGVPWGFEVTVPKGFDYRRSRASFGEWAKLGIRRADGAAMPKHGNGILFFPAQAHGPAFLVTRNFSVIKDYNFSDAYALAVAHLADRIRGQGAIQATWPADDQGPLQKAQRVEIQEALVKLGLKDKVSNLEGRVDFELRDAIRQVQVKAGMTPDGTPTAALIKHLRSAAK